MQIDTQNKINKLIAQANEAMQVRNKKKVDKIYDQLSLHFSGNQTLANIFAQIALQNNLIVEGISWLRKSLDINPSQPIALLNLGTALSEIKQFNEALGCFNKSIKLDPNNPLVYFNQGLMHRNLNELDFASQSYAKALRLDPNYADALNGIGRIFHIKEQYNEAIEYYEKAILLQPNYSEIIYNKGNALQELKRYEEALACYDQSIQLKPDYHEPYNGKGNALQELKRYEEALACYDQSIQLKPDYHEPYNGKGNALQELKRYEEALACYDQCIQLKPDYHEPYNGKGNALQELKRYEEALACYDQCIQLKPDYHEPYNGKGNALQELKRYEEALACYDQSIQLKPDEAIGYWNKSLLKLLQGDYKEGWMLYEWRRQNRYTKDNYKIYDQPLWLGKESLVNKTLLVESEQGFGDTIQFCRYVPMLQKIGAKVILQIPKELTSLLKTLHSEFLIIEKSQALPQFDFHIPIMSLPLAFQTTLNNIPASIPYLYSDKNKVKFWNNKLSKKVKLKVGIAWSGSITHKNDKNRSLLLEDLEPILRLPFEFHSLQQKIRQKDELSLIRFNNIFQHQNELNDFSDTAALIEEMDLIISADTSVAHVAGALGKDVWILLPYHPDHRWMLDRKDSPWYPTATLFRKSKINDWTDVVLEIVYKLNSL